MLGFGCAAGRGERPATYVVRPHDTLYSIAWRHDVDYHDLARWNHIGSDYHITVGQVLVLRTSAHGSAAHAAAPAKRAPATPAASTAPAVAAVPGSAGESGPPVQWVWPTAYSSAPRAVPGGGVLLLGQFGQSVRAAAPGRIVYVGNGLRAYGNLIIIKHGESWLSAYAHLSEPLVHEGQEVQGAGQIGRMGEGPHQIAALYFEIRLNGKPVDPLPLLSSSK